MSDFEDAAESFDRVDGTSFAFDGIRKRHLWESLESELPGLHEVKISEVLKVGIHDLDLGAFVNSAREPAEEFVRKVWEASWSVCNFRHLPHWLQDNDCLHNWHRPQLDSFSACFKSIFSVHTETGNIWTHLLGCFAFVTALFVFLFSGARVTPLEDALAVSTFYIAVIVCFGLSFIFHTVYCHSEFVGKLFSKLDYCGIAILITGSFVPWLYFGFYCQTTARYIYLTVVIILGVTASIVSLWDKFSESRFRPLRAGVFAGFGLSGIVPAFHYVISEGWFNAVAYASLGWLILMGILYLSGAFVYAFRFPESLYPGKFDICFQSHQIFHVLTIAAAFVHLHGITEMLTYRMSMGACAVQSAVQSTIL
ncbi:adiponectin receptor protein-like isoform X2 [Cimex lectularius]|uniref:Adiponectin receptor n=1 Tax=Cimex lectularius TaxID=79782 RepID=A0A8I6SHT8_CIMLE|nr:adiponectin receptor protein-like isoform X2 [Cimex lectularius]XP_024085805.1 adiponectin receptor protein-like isoform X2 [Cimex lectularius]